MAYIVNICLLSVTMLTGGCNYSQITAVTCNIIDI